LGLVGSGGIVLLVETKFIAGKYKIKVKLFYKNGRIFIKFPFNKKLIDEIRVMEGAKWHGFDKPNPVKMWSVADTPGNDFRIRYLKGENPYAAFKTPLIEIPESSWGRPLYDHQKEMVRHGLTRGYCVFACEMGTGKSLAAIEIMERAGVHDEHDAWYVGPVAGVKAVGRELVKWQSFVKPRMMTYDRLVRIVEDWDDGFPAPRCIIFDESSKIKNPNAKRSQAARHIAEAIREEYGEEGYVIEMSGTPAPKSPVDWFNQLETAVPGYLREGDIHKFKSRLCIIETRESGITGTTYPHIVTWLDDEKKCATCGEYRDSDNHKQFLDPVGLPIVEQKSTGLKMLEDVPVNTESFEPNPNYHPYKPSVNEVEKLYRRMDGVVLVQFKKDCLDLPDKRYEIITVKPTPSMVRAAKIIRTKATRAVMALNLLRELSDGFQYTDREVGVQKCPNCQGNGSVTAMVPKDEVDTQKPNADIDAEQFEEQTIVCDYCKGSKVVPRYERVTDSGETPKDQVFIDMLDEHEEGGRFIVWGGFTGSIDRLVAIAHKYGWATLRVDGRGYFAQEATGEVANDNDFLDAMDLSHPRYRELLSKHPRICFVGHPQAGGMALTLTASPSALFYSNCYNGEARMQAEDRFHRAGMDKNKGATVYDLFCLPTDKLIYENLQQKKKLQKISMGELNDAFTEIEKEKT